MKLSILLLLFAVISPSLAYAQEPALSFEQFQLRVLQQSPLAQQIEAKFIADRAAGEALATLENPSLDSELRRPSSSRDSHEVSIALSQPLRASDFGARDRVRRLLEESAQLEQGSALLELALNSRSLYVKVWSLEQSLSQLNAAQKRAQELERRIRQGSESGLYTAGEALLFKAESLKIANRKLRLTGQLSSAKAALARQAGFALHGALAAPVLAAPTEQSLHKRSNVQLPIQQRAALAARLAAAQQELAERDAAPEFAPRITYERDSERSDFFGVGFSVALPVFDRNQAEQKRRLAEATAAKAQQESLGGELYEQQVGAHAQALREAVLITERYEREILPALREALLAQENLLKRGQGSVFQVWQTLRELVTTQDEAIAQRLDAERERSEYVLLTGQEI
jgi:outer membrane protein TolC